MPQVFIFKVRLKSGAGLCLDAPMQLHFELRPSIKTKPIQQQLCWVQVYITDGSQSRRFQSPCSQGAVRHAEVAHQAEGAGDGQSDNDHLLVRSFCEALGFTFPKGPSAYSEDFGFLCRGSSSWLGPSTPHLRPWILWVFSWGGH